MQSGMLHKLLSSLSEVAESLENSATARDLNDLKGLFSTNDKTAVSKVVARMQKGKPDSSGGPMSPAVSRLCEVLKQFEATLTVAKSKSAGDIKLLSSLLAGCRHATIAELVSDSETWRPKPKTSRKGRASISTHPRTDVVDIYVKELRTIETDNAGFDEVVSRLKTDTRVRVAEMREIASLYLGYKIAKDKRKTLQAIVDHQAFNARQVARSQNQR